MVSVHVYDIVQFVLPLFVLAFILVWWWSILQKYLVKRFLSQVFLFLTDFPCFFHPFSRQILVINLIVICRQSFSFWITWSNLEKLTFMYLWKYSYFVLVLILFINNKVIYFQFNVLFSKMACMPIVFVLGNHFLSHLLNGLHNKWWEWAEEMILITFPLQIHQPAFMGLVKSGKAFNAIILFSTLQ